MNQTSTIPRTTLTDDDIFLFNEGTHYELWRKLGAQLTPQGTHFAVWAPNANYVSVIGDWNGWEKGTHRMEPRGSSGIWEIFVPEAKRGAKYKFHVGSHNRGYRVDKADPFGKLHEEPPKTGSVVWDHEYDWGDAKWMQTRGGKISLDAPVSIYELHYASWARVPEDNNRPLTYREMAPKLADYVKRMGYTHVELLPIMEHPFAGSWGYQVTGYFAPTSRFGTPQDFMYFVDYLHQNDIGVILDWVPAHFPTDEHGLGYFDGTHLFEHEDKRKGFHPDWNTFIFNYDRNEVKSFLISSALLWLDTYHVDGLRVDGVASMLYLDYSREAGEWIPNEYGGRENIGAIRFLQRANEVIYERHPDVQTIAEESTAWPGVSKPTYIGGLGFGMKWDMGWMHDTLQYMQRDPIHRKFHQGELTFRAIYAFHENFVLPLSHDEVVHGKGSLAGKMPGDEWQRMANLRALYAYMFATPGKKLLFMGAELGVYKEWSHDESLEWHLAEQFEHHRGVQRLVRELNRVYRSEPALHELDCDPRGFEWVHTMDAENSVLAFMRKAKNHPQEEPVLVVLNLTPAARTNYRIGVDQAGWWREIINTDAGEFWGSNTGNLGAVEATPVGVHGRQFSLNLVLPPLSALYLKPGGAP